MAEAPALVWLRQDLRLRDNPALNAAARTKRPLILFYLLDDETPGRWRMGGASRWWLHESLSALRRSAADAGLSLVLRSGVAATEIPKLCAETNAAAVHWNRSYEPFAVARDTALKQALAEAGIEVSSHNGALLFEPWSIKTKTGEPFKVFTPFWRACLQSAAARSPEPTPQKFTPTQSAPASEPLETWALQPHKPNWAAGFAPEWRPGEAGAHEALDIFIARALAAYPEARDEMGARGTSRLSPHLHFGEISPAQVYTAVTCAAEAAPALSRAADKYLAELGWREFSTHLLFHWPNLPEENWRPQFNAFPWREDKSGYDAWTRGETGYPIVDAAMRELWITGYMHNRARMIAASFLIKHLLIDWRRGEDWFWDTLVDADLANNAASWQWVAGSGADASPYFRIFNPIVQGARYDSEGGYVRRWVPELRLLPTEFIHAPWMAGDETLRTAGVELGASYPRPIVDHAEARARALGAFATL